MSDTFIPGKAELLITVRCLDISWNCPDNIDFDLPTSAEVDIFDAGDPVENERRALSALSQDYGYEATECTIKQAPEQSSGMSV